MRVLLVLAMFLTLAGTPACSTVAEPSGEPPTATTLTGGAVSHDSSGHGHGCHHLTPEPPAVVGAIGPPTASAAPAVLPLAGPVRRVIVRPPGRGSTVDPFRPDGRDLLIAHGIART